MSFKPSDTHADRVPPFIAIASLNNSSSGSSPTTDDDDSLDGVKWIGAPESTLWCYGYLPLPQVLAVSSNTQMPRDEQPRPERDDYDLVERQEGVVALAKLEVVGTIQQVLPQAGGFMFKNIGYTRESAQFTCHIAVPRHSTTHLEAVKLIRALGRVFLKYDPGNVVIEVVENPMEDQGVEIPRPTVPTIEYDGECIIEYFPGPENPLVYAR